MGECYCIFIDGAVSQKPLSLLALGYPVPTLSLGEGAGVRGGRGQLLSVPNSYTPKLLAIFDSAVTLLPFRSESYALFRRQHFGSVGQCLSETLRCRFAQL